ncbi:hypothetical protein [Oceanobacillus sp. CAU 1775]
MRCGEKCFLVEFEIDGEKHLKSINARTPAESRRFTRKEYGDEITILSARQKKAIQ